MMRNLIALAALLFGLAFAAPAWAHAHLVNSDPPVGGTAAATDTIRLTFSEGIEVNFSKVEVTMSDGMDMGPAKLALDPNDAKILVLTYPFKFAPGGYKVHWHVVSVDTHHTEGTFEFTVK